MAKPTYSKPTSQLDLEARQAKDYTPPGVVKPGEDQPLSTNGYVATDPIYQNHANDTEAPVQAEKGAEAKIFDQHYADDVDFDSTGPDEGFDEGWTAADSEQSDDDNKQSGGGTGQAPPPSGGSTPPSGQS